MSANIRSFLTTLERLQYAATHQDLGFTFYDSQEGLYYRCVREGAGSDSWRLETDSDGAGGGLASEITNDSGVPGDNVAEALDYLNETANYTEELDLYLAVTGDDEANTGASDSPFETFARVKEEIDSYSGIGILTIYIQGSYSPAMTQLDCSRVGALRIVGVERSYLTSNIAASIGSGVSWIRIPGSGDGTGYRDCFVEVTSGAAQGELRLLQGYARHPDVASATTANITLSGLQTIDGVSGSEGQRVLVRAQTTASNNGIYLQSSSTWTRALDAFHPRTLNGAEVEVAGGSTLGGNVYRQTFRITSLGSTQSWLTGDNAFIPVLDFIGAFTTGDTFRIFEPASGLDLTNSIADTEYRPNVIGPCPVALINLELSGGGGFWCEGELSLAGVRSDSYVYGSRVECGSVGYSADYISDVLATSWAGYGAVLNQPFLSTTQISGYINFTSGIADAATPGTLELDGGRIDGDLTLSAGSTAKVSSLSNGVVFGGEVTVSNNSRLIISHVAVFASETDIETCVRAHSGGYVFLASVNGAGVGGYGIDARGGGRVHVASSTEVLGDLGDCRVNSATEPYTYFAADGDTISDSDGSIICRGSEGTNTSGSSLTAYLPVQDNAVARFRGTAAGAEGIESSSMSIADDGSIASGLEMPWAHTGSGYTTPKVVSAVSTTFTIDCRDSNRFNITLAANSTIAFSNLLSGQEFTIYVNQTGGPWTLTWPSDGSVEWPEGSDLTPHPTQYTLYGCSTRSGVVRIVKAADGWAPTNVSAPLQVGSAITIISDAPGSPSAGDSYVIGPDLDSGSGDWYDDGATVGQIATYDGTQWHYVTPSYGSVIYVNDQLYIYTTTQEYGDTNQDSWVPVEGLAGGDFLARYSGSNELGSVGVKCVYPTSSVREGFFVVPEVEEAASALYDYTTAVIIRNITTGDADLNDGDLVVCRTWGLVTVSSSLFFGASPGDPVFNSTDGYITTDSNETTMRVGRVLRYELVGEAVLADVWLDIEHSPNPEPILTNLTVSGATSLLGPIRSSFVTVTPSANVFAVNFNNGTNFLGTLAANSTVTISNATDGQHGFCAFDNNGGSWTLGWPTGSSVQRKNGQTLAQVGTGWTIYEYLVRGTTTYVWVVSTTQWENNA